MLIFATVFFYIYNMDNQSHEIAKQIRREFFIYRNGMLADTLREAGDPHRMIFGLNLSQITDIAKRFAANGNVADELWNSKDTRECRLIAPMLYPIDTFTQETASKWITTIESTEVADNLCHKLLKNTSFANELCLQFSTGNTLERYTALVLAINLITIGKSIDIETILAFAQAEQKKNNRTTQAVANRLIEDIQELHSM